MDLLLGLDLGSTSIKANIYNREGSLVSQGSKATILSHPDANHPSGSAWELDIIWNAVKESIRIALSKINFKYDLKAISVTGFGMDGIPIDKNGKWLYPFISWHCLRTADQCEKWSKKVGLNKIFSITGKQ